MVLLEYDQEKLKTMYERDELQFFITRICLNNYCSTTSPFYKTFRKFNNKCEDGNYTTETAEKYEKKLGKDFIKGLEEDSV